MVYVLFGAGEVFFRDSTSKIIEVAEVKDVGVNFDIGTKEFQGTKIFAQDVAVVSCKVSGKMKYSLIKGDLLAAALGGSSTAGITKITRVVVPASASVTVEHGEHFVEDLGVTDADNVPLERVTGEPAAGQYVAGVPGVGAYSFGPGRSGNIAIRYAYSSPAGRTISVTNRDQGPAVSFQMHLSNTYKESTFGMRFFNVVIPKLALAFKAGDYVEPDLDFQASADPLGRVYEKYIG